MQSSENRAINQSELAHFQYYFLPLAALFLYSAKRRTLTALELGLGVMISFILIYMLVDIGHKLSTLSLWSYVPAKRAHLSLGLACLILTYLLLSQHRNVAVTEAVRFIAALIALVWAGLVYRGVRAFDGPQMSGSNISIVLGVTFIAFACGYLLITRQPRAFLGLSLGLTLAMTTTFNPLYIAPHQLKNNLTQHGAAVLTLGSQIPAMFLAASGQPVINGIFYYPQHTLWARLDPDDRHVQLYNRYQHLMFFSQPGIEATQIVVPTPDTVRVLINPEHMDFNITGAQLLLALDNEHALLSRNPTLTWLRSEKGWGWYRVKPAP